MKHSQLGSVKEIITAGTLGTVTLFLIFVVTYALYFTSSSSFNKQSAEMRLEANNSIAKEINGELDYNIGFLQYIAGLIKEDTTLADIIIKNTVSSNGKFYTLSSISFFNTNGISKVDGINLNISTRNYFVKCQKNGFAISEPLISLVSGERSIIYCVPVIKNSNTIGYLVAEEKMEQLEAILKSSNSFSDKAFIRITDSKGNYIATSDDFKFNSCRNILEDYSNIWDDYDQAVADSKKARALKTSGYRIHKRNGTKYINMYSPLNYNDWFICSAAPLRAYTTQALIHSTILIIICVILCFSTITTLVYIAIMQQKHQQKLHYLAYTDELTGHGNYKWFITECEKTIKENPDTKYAVVSINIDHFKLYNKQFGRAKGDEKLLSVFNTIENNLSDEEIIVRSYGDNFKVLMKFEKDIKIITERLKNISNEINKSEIQINGKNPYIINLRAGVCSLYTYNLDGKRENLDFLSCCDRSAFSIENAKSEPNSFLKIGYFNEEDLIVINSKKIIENRMRSALRDEEFIVYLQPKFSLTENKILGAEALVRWESPNRGTELPANFIPIFESNGFILDLDLYVFDKICHMLRVWLDKGIVPITISVNLSRAYLNDLNFIDAFEKVRKKYGVPTKYIELEITETVVIENSTILSDIVHIIHELGYSCSIDDFGAGYSSLNLLKDIPVDTIKIDKGFFIGENADSLQSNIIVKSVINLAKKLKMKTVSEGIEDEEQVNFLKEAECDMIQGFYFSKPIPTSEFEKKVFGLAISDTHQLSDMNLSEFEIGDITFPENYKEDYPASDKFL